MPPRRTDNRIIEELREAMAAGVPWIYRQDARGRARYADLIFLVEGLYYPVCDFIHGKDESKP